jgi:hypothetical protein
VITLAAIALEFDLQDHRDVLRMWFLSRSFGLAYDTAANTVTVEQYRHLRAVLRREVELRRVIIGSAILRDATRKRRGALWRVFLAALTMAGARDPISGAEIEDPRPASLLPRERQPRPGTESAHLLILGMVLAEREHVRTIEATGLEGMLTQVRALPVLTASRVLKSQFLERVETVSDPLPRGLEQFLEARLLALDRWLIAQLGYGLDAGAEPNPVAG